MAEEIIPIPNLSLSQNLFTLITPNFKHLHDNAREELLEGIKADSMLCDRLACYSTDQIGGAHRNGAILPTSNTIRFSYS